MGLLDILNGMQNGPRGPSDPNDKSGGMSPMTMAILAMLAWKGYKHFGGDNKQVAPAGQPGHDTAQVDQGGLGGGLGGILGGLLGGGASNPRGGQATQGGGGIGDLLKGGLGGLLAGGAAGSILGGGLSGGLGDLMKQLQDHGQGDAAQSWVGDGPNKQIAPNDLANALGADQIDHLTSRTGMSREQLLSELSNELPDAVNHFTPHGRIPTDDEISHYA
jgi:uncharacterized protein YidB (DUF937 family)